MPIDEDSTDTESESFSPRRSGRGGASPRGDVDFQEGGIGGGFSPDSDLRIRRQSKTTKDPTIDRTEYRRFIPRQDYLLPKKAEDKKEEKQNPSTVVAEPAQVPSQRIPELEGVESGVVVDRRF